MGKRAGQLFTQDSKKQKILDTSERVKESERCLYYTNKIKIPDMFNVNAMYLKDILSMNKEEYVSSAHFNYCIDINWLTSQYPDENKNKPILIIHGFKGNDKEMLENSSKMYSNINFVQAKLNIPFGTHHTKMIFILYKDGLRVIILTANMIQEDWDAKTQGFWISPKFPIQKDKKSCDDFDFKKDLLAYLASYQSPKLKTWENHIQSHDMSLANVKLVASVPGRHIGKNINEWGHLKLRNILSQCSSIGSLGSKKESWLCNEFLGSLLQIESTTKKFFDKNYKPQHLQNTTAKNDSFHLVFPTLENVKNSFEGYIAGGSIPYSNQTHSKQKYLSDHMCEWKSNALGRSRASPHIKTYARISEDGTKLRWLLLTSANLSKAAWGTLEKNNTQLAIRSYELGVLFLPKFCGILDQDYFNLSGSYINNEIKQIPRMYLPYDYPLAKYSSNDNPWEKKNIRRGKLIPN
ncbi:unnamed protein product [Gordionus sp. m RMFG-2023]